MDTEPEVRRGGEGTPVVLLHGAAMSWQAWLPVIPELENYHRVIAPTLPGHRGGTSWDRSEPFTIDRLVDAVSDQLDDEGVDTAHIVGNSLGGWVAIELARRGRAESVTALSPAGAWRSGLDLMRLQWSFRLMRRVAHPAFAPVLERWPVMRRVAFRRALEHGERIPAHLVRGLVEDIRKCEILGPLTKGSSTHGPTRAMPSLPCPVRISWAQHDRMIPWRAYGAPMRTVLPHAEFVGMPGVGHVPMWDDPTLVADYILELSLAVDAGERLHA